MRLGKAIIVVVKEEEEEVEDEKDMTLININDTWSCFRKRSSQPKCTRYFIE